MIFVEINNIHINNCQCIISIFLSSFLIFISLICPIEILFFQDNEIEKKNDLFWNEVFGGKRELSYSSIYRKVKF